MRLLMVCAVLLASTACVGEDVQYDTTDGTGLATFYVSVSEATGLIFTAEGEDASQLVLIRTVTNPDGDVVFDASETWSSSYSTTAAGFPGTAVSLNWPIVPGQQVEEGRWVVDVAAGYYGSDDYFYYESGIDVVLSTTTKSDSDFDAGSMVAAIVYNGSTASDADLQSAMETAESHWASIYSGIGIDVEFEYSEYDGDDRLAAPSFGDAADYEAISASTTERSVNVVISDSITNGDTLYGVAGGIPGPLVPTGSSGVIISATSHAGSNGTFSNYEKELLGETMAHEVGHYLGLFHPVEISLESWDALDDTPACSTQSGCEDQLGDNLMFPYPVYDALSGGYVSQDQLSDDQAAVQNRYTAVD